MNIFTAFATLVLGLVICVASLAQAGGDKSARTTVITLAGGGDKHGGGYPIPVPIPVCAGKMHGYGGHHGHGSYGGGYGGAQARMGWRR